MKRNVSKRITAIITALACFGLCGCGDENSSGGENAVGGNFANTEKGSGKSLSDETAFAYKSSRTKLQGELAGDVYRTAYRGGKIYMITAETDYENNTENRYLNVCNGDGSGLVSLKKEDISPCTPAFDSSGKGYVLCEKYDEDSNKITEMYLSALNDDLTEGEKTDISAAAEHLDSNGYIRGFAFDREDNICVFGSDGFAVLDRNGAYIYSGEYPDEVQYSIMCVKDSSGKLWLYNFNYSGGFDLYSFDSVNKKDIEKVNSYAPNDDGWYSSSLICGGDENADLYFCDHDGVYAYHIESNSAEELFTLSEAGISESAAEYMYFDDGKFIFSGQDFRSGEPVFTEAVKTELTAADLEKKEITAGGLSYAFSAGLSYAAAEYGNITGNARVNLKKYTDIDEFNTAVTAGDPPDIFITSSEMPVNSYISKGMFCDLGEMIDNDGEMSRDDLLPNLLNAFERNGKIYTLADSFMLRTAVCKATLAEGRESLTFEDIEEIAANAPEGADMFTGYSREGLLQGLLYISGGDLINYADRTCSFDSDGFIKLLKFADKYGAAEIGDDFYENFSLESTFAEDEGLFMVTMLTDFRDLGYFEENIFFDEVTPIGVPTESGSGSSFEMGLTFGIYSGSENKDISWDFLRTLLLPENQDNTESFPVLRSSFEKRKKDAVDGKFPGDGYYTAYINVGDICYGVGTDGKFVPDEKTAEQTEKAVLSAEHAMTADQKIYDIIDEEASAFFGGARSAAETAGLIQNRVQLYLSE